MWAFTISRRKEESRMGISPPAIEVVVRDASTLELLADEATGYIVDGTFIEDLEVTSFVYNESRGEYEGFSLTNESSRAGTYDVFVNVEGYTEWFKEGVVVLESECNVLTVRLEAFLEME